MSRRADLRCTYVNAVLAVYRATPGTHPYVRKADVRLAGHLYDRGIDQRVVEDAIAVALCRRLVRLDPPADPVRSLHYFLPVIDELLAGDLDQDYVAYLRACLARHLGKTAGTR